MKYPKSLVLSVFAGLQAVFLVPVYAADFDVATEVDVRPVPLKTPPPVFPYLMKREGVDGMVAVRALINEKGAVIECTIAKSSRVEFEQSAMEAVRNWKFKPATKDGVAVKMRVVIPIKFSQDS